MERQKYGDQLLITLAFVVPYSVNYFNLLFLIIEEDNLKYTSHNDPRPADIENKITSKTQIIKMISFVFGLYYSVALFRTSRAVRRRYAIPEEFCCGDFACIFCCTPCAVAQYGRHTADDEKYQSKCCSATGIPGSLL